MHVTIAGWLLEAHYNQEINEKHHKPAHPAAGPHNLLRLAECLLAICNTKSSTSQSPPMQVAGQQQQQFHSPHQAAADPAADSSCNADCSA
jgi:hypothetical protein